MAPEILRGEDYTEKADVYSFGLILWEIITGKIPYENLSPSDIIQKVGYENYQVAVPTKGITIFISIIEKCLQQNPANRPNFKWIVSQLNEKYFERQKQLNVVKEIKWFFGF